MREYVTTEEKEVLQRAGWDVFRWGFNPNVWALGGAGRSADTITRRKEYWESCDGGRHDTAEEAIKATGEYIMKQAKRLRADVYALETIATTMAEGVARVTDMP